MCVYAFAWVSLYVCACVLVVLPDYFFWCVVQEDLAQMTLPCCTVDVVRVFEWIRALPGVTQQVEFSHFSVFDIIQKIPRCCYKNNKCLLSFE